MRTKYNKNAWYEKYGHSMGSIKVSGWRYNISKQPREKNNRHLN
jgi:hypothetical protein